MDNRQAVFGIRPDVAQFRQGAQLGLEPAGDKLFHVRCIHAREKCRDDNLTDYDRRIFLAREIKEQHQTDKYHCGNENNRQPAEF
jgi:hypothetical protein